MKLWILGIILMLLGGLFGCASPQIPASNSKLQTPAPIENIESADHISHAANMVLYDASSRAQPQLVLPPPPAATVTVLPPAVVLKWDASEGAVTYQVYWGTAAHSYSDLQTVGTNTTVTITGLNAGQTYHFAVTAIDEFNNESDFSYEVAGVALAHLILRFGMAGALESSTNLFDWSPRAAMPDGDSWDVSMNPAIRPNEFFRIVSSPTNQ